MKQPSTATRRLVKSPPELWAELSSEESLGRHLAEFGEIRITRVKPETTVAWEGDRASGTVELTPTGWGTKVMLTATPAKAPPPSQRAVAAVPAQVAEPPREAAEVAPPAAVEVAPAAAERPDRVVLRPRPARVEPEPRPEAPRGFFARLFRKRAPKPEASGHTPPKPEASIPAPPAPAPDPTPPAPVPAPGPVPPPAPDPVPPTPTPQPPPPPQIEVLDPERTVAILTEVLDDLGAAHHRPFSRD